MGVVMELSLEQELDIHLVLLGGGTKTDNTNIIKMCIQAIDHFWEGSDDLILLPEELRVPTLSPAVSHTLIIDTFKLNYWLPERAVG